jgi:AbrB family looped-hinge helix DNA binding protein
MTKTITIDRAGRIILPKRVRDEFHLREGDHLELESAEGRITLRPAFPPRTLCREQGVWVYRTGRKTDGSISAWTDRTREERLDSLT